MQSGSRQPSGPAYAEHPGLGWLRASDAGREWLAALPRLVAECADQWSLSVGEPFPYAYASLALPAVRSDQTPAVLKVQFPDRDSEHERAALEHWGGNGAVLLLAADRQRHALLLERCQPGVPLSAAEPEAALGVLVGLLPRLCTPAGAPFRSLANEAAHWAESLPASWNRAGQPFERRLLDAAVELLGWLPRSQGGQVLVNEDLHAGNVLRARREPWLVIDPKPLVGEREFAVAPVVRGTELGHDPELVRRRLDRLVAELGLDRERARGWTIAHTLAWSFEGDTVLEQHLDTVRWLLEGN